jgi:hypothetical protein
MATWHQSRGRRHANCKRNPTPLYHATLWTVLIDPPGGFASSMRFATREEAELYIARLSLTAGVVLLKPANAEAEA